ncbi:MAG TPA: YdcF family protein [Flavitalea sp.]|nr:YdcF family protein [Flavitalea sp.]
MSRKLQTRLSQDILDKAQLLWDYHHMNHQPQKSDCILVLGSHDLRVAERGAELYLQQFAPLLIFSGGFGNFTKETWTSSEADLFAQKAIEMGVPENAIMRENKSTNTGENILFTRRLLLQHNIDPETFLLVQKPYMERRSYATFKKNWPDKALLVTSPQINFNDYATEEIPLEKVINIMVGDLQRIKLYPARGYQVFQEIPDEVWTACEDLITSGFNRHLMKD